MSFELMQDLTSIIKFEIAKLGGDWRELVYSDPVEGREWKALSMIQPGKTYGIDNRLLMQVPIKLCVEEFVDVYEKFLKAANKDYSDFELYTRLKKSLGLNDRQAIALFPRPDNENLYNYVPSLAALAYYNFDSELIRLSFTDIVVTVGNYSFGLKDGRVITNDERKRYRAVPVPEFARPPIAYGRRESLPETEFSARLATLLSWAGRTACAVKDLEEMNTAFTILVANESQNLKELWGFGVDNNTNFPAEVNATIEVAKNFREFFDPYEFLKEQLIPLVMTIREFNQWFGKDRTTTPERFEQLDIALSELSEQLKREREK